MSEGMRHILDGSDPASIERAAELLRAGGLVGMPTETVYGLAGLALDGGAVAGIFAAKGRPSFDPLIVHVESIEQAHGLAEFPQAALRLAQAFWPGPLTLVLPRVLGEGGAPVVPDLVTAGLDSVGLRMPDHAVARALINACGPLAAPSANRFGSISPTTAQHVVEELGDKIACVLDGGPCQRGLESTVVRVTERGVEVLRLGALAVDQIEEVVGRAVPVREPSSSPGAGAKPSPGMVDRHYAPGTPMVLVDGLDVLTAEAKTGRVGLVGIGQLSGGGDGFACVRSLSESGDMSEAASNLFRMLRELDAMDLDGIIALKVPDEGIGRAINDRLRRGSAR